MTVIEAAEEELKELNEDILWLERNRPRKWKKKVRGLVARCQQIHRSLVKLSTLYKEVHK